MSRKSKKARQAPGAATARGNKAVWSALGVALAVFIAAIAAGLVLRQSPRADPDDPAQAARGRAIYAQYCASCHGANLEGQPDWRTRRPNGRLPAPPHDETGHTWHHPDQVLFDITKRGLVPPLAPQGYESDMPAYAGVLTDDEIWAVLAYIKSRWSDRVLAARREMLGARR